MTYKFYDSFGSGSSKMSVLGKTKARNRVRSKETKELTATITIVIAIIHGTSSPCYIITIAVGLPTLGSHTELFSLQIFFSIYLHIGNGGTLGVVLQARSPRSCEIDLHSSVPSLPSHPHPWHQTICPASGRAT